MLNDKKATLKDWRIAADLEEPKGYQMIYNYDSNWFKILYWIKMKVSESSQCVSRRGHCGISLNALNKFHIFTG